MNDLEQMIMDTLKSKAHDMPDHAATPDGLVGRTRHRAHMKTIGLAAGGLAAVLLVVGLVLPGFATEGRTKAPVATEPNPRKTTNDDSATTTAVPAPTPTPIVAVTTDPAPVVPARAEEFVYAYNGVLSVYGRDGKEHRVITNLGADKVITEVTVSPDGAWVYFMAYPKEGCGEGSPAMEKVAISGGPVSQVIESTGSYLRVSPDGTKMAFIQGDCQRRPVIVDLATGKETVVTAPGLTADAGQYGSIEWSPDGRQISIQDTVIDGRDSGHDGLVDGSDIWHNEVVILDVGADGTSFAVNRRIPIAGGIAMASEDRAGVWKLIVQPDPRTCTASLVTFGSPECPAVRIDANHPEKVETLGHSTSQLVSFDRRSHDWLMVDDSTDSAREVTATWLVLPGGIRVTPSVPATRGVLRNTAAAWIPAK